MRSCPIEPLSKTAFFQKLFFQCAQLLIEQVVCLVYQADHGICSNFRRRSLQISLIGHIGLILAVRQLAHSKNKSYMTYKTYLEASPPEVAANAMICLVHQTNYLLDQQLRALEKEFLEEGGFTERLYRTRTQIRNRNRNR